MAHFARIRASGFWTIASAFQPSEAEAFDAHQFAAINGDAGGTWAPSARIIIGGLGIHMDGPFVAADGIQVAAGTAEFDDIATFNGAATFNDAASFIGAVSLRGTTLHGDLHVGSTGRVFVDTGQVLQLDAGSFGHLYSTWTNHSGSTTAFATGSALTFAGTAAVSGTIASGSLALGGGTTWDFQGTLQSTGTFNATGVFGGAPTGGTLTLPAGFYFNNAGNTNLTGTTNIGGTPSMNAQLVLYGAGSISDRVLHGDETAGATTSYGVDLHDEVYLNSGSLTGHCHYHITITGARSGSRIRISNVPGSTTLPYGAEVVWPVTGGGSVNRYVGGAAAGAVDWLDLVFDAGGWRLSACGKI